MPREGLIRLEWQFGQTDVTLYSSGFVAQVANGDMGYMGYMGYRPIAVNASLVPS